MTIKQITISRSMAEDLYQSNELEPSYLEQVAKETIEDNNGDQTAYMFADGSVLIYDHETDEVDVAFIEYGEDGAYFDKVSNEHLTSLTTLN